MSLLAKEISERPWVVSFAKLRALWHMTIPAAAFQSIDHPSSQTRGDFAFFPFVLKCLHGNSLVVVVISSCFGMELQSKYASVCLLKQLSVVYEGINCLFKTCQTLFCCLEISFGHQDVFGMLWCAGIFLFMSSSWLNTFTNQQCYFLDEQLGCQKQSNQSSSRSLCVSVLFVVISHAILERRCTEFCWNTDLRGGRRSVWNLF